MSDKGKNKVPESILGLLSAADKQNGFPPGTMASVMQQEIGGQFDKYLGDPSAYHYAAGPDGRRVAKHTGKVSTAFGPFGILESTGRDPGYGVKPLQNKTIEEQVRFAGEYLAARSKRAGGLKGGLAGYGEGDKYATQVAGRLPEGTAPTHPLQQPIPVQAGAPVEVAQDGAEKPAFTWDDLGPAASANTVPATQVTGVPAAGKSWEQFLAQMGDRPAVQPENLAYGAQGMEVNRPDFMGMVAQRPPVQQPNFAQSFGRGWANV